MIGHVEFPRRETVKNIRDIADFCRQHALEGVAWAADCADRPSYFALEAGIPEALDWRPFWTRALRAHNRGGCRQ